MLLKSKYKKEDIDKIVDFAVAEGIDTASIKFARSKCVIKGWAKKRGITLNKEKDLDIEVSTYDKYIKLIRRIKNVNH